MPPFAMKTRASVPSSPLIIWREMCELSFSCSSFSNDVAAGMGHLFLFQRNYATENPLLKTGNRQWLEEATKRLWRGARFD
jgi:hypothetical protein